MMKIKIRPGRFGLFFHSKFSIVLWILQRWVERLDFGFTGNSFAWTLNERMFFVESLITSQASIYEWLEPYGLGWLELFGACESIVCRSLVANIVLENVTSNSDKKDVSGTFHNLKNFEAFDNNWQVISTQFLC